MMELQKMAYVVGHRKSSPGAYSPHGILPEFEFNSEIVKQIDSPYIDIYFYEDTPGYMNRVEKLAEEVNSKDYKAVIELHYNSTKNPKANGTEALFFKGSIVGKEIAEGLSSSFSLGFNLKNRGVKALSNSNQRGYGFLESIKAPAIIFEPIFGSNKDDVEAYKRFDTFYPAFLTYIGEEITRNK